MHADARKPSADCMWLYAIGNHYQLVGPMQQLVVMQTAARNVSKDADQDFVLVPHGMRCKPP